MIRGKNLATACAEIASADDAVAPDQTQWQEHVSLPQEKLVSLHL